MSSVRITLTAQVRFDHGLYLYLGEPTCTVLPTLTLLDYVVPPSMGGLAAHAAVS